MPGLHFRWHSQAQTIEVDLWVRLREMQMSRNALVVQRKSDFNETSDASAGLQVTDVRFH